MPLNVVSGARLCCPPYDSRAGASHGQARFIHRRYRAPTLAHTGRYRPSSWLCAATLLTQPQPPGVCTEGKLAIRRLLGSGGGGGPPVPLQDVLSFLVLLRLVERLLLYRAPRRPPLSFSQHPRVPSSPRARLKRHDSMVTRWPTTRLDGAPAERRRSHISASRATRKGHTYVSPAHHLQAHVAVDVGHRVQARGHQAVLAWAHRDVHHSREEIRLAVPAVKALRRTARPCTASFVLLAGLGACRLA